MAETETGGPATRVGVIGLGQIGSGVASNVATAGLSVVVCDVAEAATARFADRATIAQSPALLGTLCDVLVVAVVNDEQVISVLDGSDGALSTLSPGAVVVVLSTISLHSIEEMAAAASRRGVDLIDCGVSGGPAASAAGELVSMVGGDEAAIDRAQPVLDAFSSLVVRMGPLGSGLVAKLARNVVQYGSWLAAYEGQRIAEAAGIELAKLAQVIRASDVKIGGPSTLMFRPTVAPLGPDDHEGLVAAMRTGAALAHKDLRAALEVGAQMGLDLPVAEMTDAQCDSIFGVGEERTAP